MSDAVTGIAIVDAALEKAVSIPSAAVHAHVDRLRRRNPEATPMDIVLLLEKQYLTTVSASGGAVGAAAAVPAVGTATGVALTSAEVATFFATSAAFALAVADVHGIAVEDTARRRAMLMATVLGEQGTRAVRNEAGLSGTSWARAVLVNMPTTTIRRVNTVLTRKLIRRQAGKQGALALGRLAPFGIGAFIGATGARALGKTVVSSARTAFGPPPAAFPRVIEIAATETEPRRVESRPRRRLIGSRRAGNPSTSSAVSDPHASSAAALNPGASSAVSAPHTSRAVSDPHASGAALDPGASGAISDPHTSGAVIDPRTSNDRASRNGDPSAG